MLQKTFRRLITLAKVIRVYKSWPLWLRRRFHLLDDRDSVDRFVLRGNIIFYNVFGNEIGLFDEIWRDRIYGPLSSVKDGGVVIDIGAHMGVFSILAATTIRNVRVYSYEPAPENFNRLLYNIESNHLEKSIRYFQLGVGGSRGEQVLLLSRHASGLHTFNLSRSNLEIDDRTPIKINVITLEDVFRTNNIASCDFLKIDTEGSEYDIIFRTPTATLHKIKYIAIEYHDGPEELKIFLTAHNFFVNIKPAQDARYGILYAENKVK